MRHVQHQQPGSVCQTQGNRRVVYVHLPKYSKMEFAGRGYTHTRHESWHHTSDTNNEFSQLLLPPITITSSSSSLLDHYAVLMQLQQAYDSNHGQEPSPHKMYAASLIPETLELHTAYRLAMPTTATGTKHTLQLLQSRSHCYSTVKPRAAYSCSVPLHTNCTHHHYSHNLCMFCDTTTTSSCCASPY